MFVPAPTSRSRSLLKAVTWRAVGSVDTFMISFIIATLLHHPMAGAATLAGSIATSETFTKLILYFIHERIWARIRWGRADTILKGEAIPG
ncbi:MAG: DUF2061 domain-containing protein [Caulobacteraceae bacterium]